MKTIDVGGTPRQVILDVPDAVRAGTPAPVLLDFHGFRHSGAGVWDVSGFKALAAREGFITAYPEGLPITLRLRGEEMQGAGWQMDAVAGNRDVAFTTALLDQLERDYCVDRRRIYSTGFSNGAFFSQLLACALSPRIAAVAPVSGGTLRIDCTPARPVPILIQHGSEDDLDPGHLGPRDPRPLAHPRRLPGRCPGRRPSLPALERLPRRRRGRVLRGALRPSLAAGGDRPGVDVSLHQDPALTPSTQRHRDAESHPDRTLRLCASVLKGEG